MTCRWVKFRSRGKYVIRSSAFLPRVPHWGVGWEPNFPKTLIDKLDPDSTASMQKDLARGHESEIQGLLFDMIAAAEEQGIDIPTYRMVAEKFTKH